MEASDFIREGQQTTLPLETHRIPKKICTLRVPLNTEKFSMDLIEKIEFIPHTK